MWLCELVKLSSMQCTPQQRIVLGLTITLDHVPFRDRDSKMKAGYSGFCIKQ